MNRDQSYLLDLAKYSQTILQLTEEMNEMAFMEDERTQFAVLYAITIIGEIAKKLSSDFRETHKTIQWKEIAGMRDKIVHDYSTIKIDIVWQVIQFKIPELLTYITPLLPEKE